MTELSTARFFELRSEFQQAVLDTIAGAETELLMYDPTFADWQMNSTAVQEALLAFLQGHSRASIKMVIGDVNRINADYPRMARTLALQAHRIDVMVTPDRYAQLDETMLIADRAHALRRPLASRTKGVVRRFDPDYVGAQRERFEELWNACSDRYSPTSLGL